MNKGIILKLNENREDSDIQIKTKLTGYPLCKCGCEADRHWYDTAIYIEPNTHPLIQSMSVDISACAQLSCSCLKYEENYSQ